MHLHLANGHTAHLDENQQREFLLTTAECHHGRRKTVSRSHSVQQHIDEAKPGGRTYRPKRAPRKALKMLQTAASSILHSLSRSASLESRNVYASPSFCLVASWFFFIFLGGTSYRVGVRTWTCRAAFLTSRINCANSCQTLCMCVTFNMGRAIACK